jgi:hypothetical protein
MLPDFKEKIIADKYRIDSLIRSGDLGQLYSATHRLMDKPFAVRVLPPHLSIDQNIVDAFFAMAKAESNVSHQGVPEVIDFGTDSAGVVYCVYEAITGDSLKSVVTADGRFPVATALAIGRQIAAALAAAHSSGLVHGNLTTENVLLFNDAEGGINIKLLDFGSADPMAADDTGLAPTEFAYLSPEQCSGTKAADEKSDIYALGVILYEMLTGVPPFAGEKPTDVLIKHIEEPPAPMIAFRNDIPAAVEPIVLKALSKNPEMRQQSASELATELENASVEETVADRAIAASSGGLWKTALLILVGIGMVASALIYATSVTRTDPATALQPDANGLPVQPLNPATGIEEKNLASMTGGVQYGDANVNNGVPPSTLPGGDGYNPWGNGVPPPGAPPPTYIGPGGQTVTIDPNNPSPFMQDCIPQPSGVLLCFGPPPINAAVKPTPTPRPSPTVNANAAAPTEPAPSPQSTPAETRPTPSPAKPTPPAPDANRPATGSDGNTTDN